MIDPGVLAEAFLEQSPCCHWIVSAGGAFQRVDGNCRPLLGKSAEDLLGRAVSEVLDPETAGIWTERFDRALGGEVLLLRERRGESIWFVTLFPLRLPARKGQARAARFSAGSAREITPWSAADQELRNTVLSALKAQEYERRMVSRFLHDKIGQNLTALGLQLDLVRMDLEAVTPATSARVAEVQQHLEDMMEEVRDYSYELNPATVERAGLRSALDRLTGRIRNRYAGVLRVNADPSLKLDPKIASAMYQIAQEAVENAVQHSSCSSIEIAVKSTRSGPSVEVRDNGRGFDPADILGGRRGLGLLSMEHYAAQAGLNLTIRSSRETGTVVRASTGSD